MHADDLAATDLAAEIVEPRLQKLYAYWTGVRGTRRLPARRDIDPLDFAYMLGHVMLIDVLRDPLGFRVRVHGTERVRRAGYDLTGKSLEDIPTPDYRSYAIERCRKLVKTAEPALVHYAREFDGRYYRYEAIWLPLSEDGKKVSQLVCALLYQS